jgi:hypothetical protein
VYKNPGQIALADFIFPYGRLKEDNRWVKMASLVPWEDVERDYAPRFADGGAPAHPARMALGALLAKQVLHCSDRELVEHVAENPYLQYFLGLSEFTEQCPFGASTLVAFRVRFSVEDIVRINDAMLDRAAKEAARKDDVEGGGEDSVCGGDGDGEDNGCGGDGLTAGGVGAHELTMSLDATVAPSDIAYPQDMRLLDEARRCLEGAIDDVCAETGARRPRMYRDVARREFLAWSKSKKRGAKKTRKAVRKQLAYIKRDLGYYHDLTKRYAPDCEIFQMGMIETIEALFAQQLYMYENNTHSVKDRIVSLSQPWVRPIVRGKAAANTEFGAKVHISTDDEGHARIERLSFDAFNESDGLIAAAERFFERYGRWPNRILADKIYRTRDNISWCKERGIRLSGPKLGRPLKAAALSREQKAVERRDAAERNVVEGVFGTAKRTYGLDCVATRLEDTTKTVIGVIVMAFNLKKLLASSFCLFSGAGAWLQRRLAALCGLLVTAPRPTGRPRATGLLGRVALAMSA